jgi:lipopolysaccharide biosynthesis regulator YciM
VANPHQSSPPGSSRAARDASKSKPSNQDQRVSAAITLGDFYLSRGDYDKAIRAYQEGLSADSSNATLQSKLTRAKNVKAAEKQALP